MCGSAQNADRRIHQFQGALGLLHFELRFVLPRQVHVTDAAFARRSSSHRGRPSRAPAPACRASVTIGHGVLAAPTTEHDRTPGAEEPQLAITGCLRVRRDDVDAWLHQIRPVLDALWISFADDEHDRRDVRQRTIRQPLAHSAIRPLARSRWCRRQGQRHDVGLEPVDHRAGLRARAAVRLLDRSFVFASLDSRDEHGVDVAPQLACRVIRHIEQFERLGLTTPTRDLGILVSRPTVLTSWYRSSSRIVRHIQEGRVFLRRSHWHDASTGHKDQKDIQ